MSNVKQKLQRGVARIVKVFREEDGITVIEILLILVVLIALVVIFKDQLTDLINTIFQKITSESSGI